MDTAKLLAAFDAEAEASCVRSGKALAREASDFRRRQQALAVKLDTTRADRVQCQLIVAGDSLLTVLNTQVYNRFIQFMLDPRTGFPGMRCTALASPLKMPPCLVVDNMRPLNELLERVYAAHAAAAVDALEDEVWTEFLQRVLHSWDALEMPAERVQLFVLQPRAEPGSLVLWKGWHGSRGLTDSSQPNVSMFIDYARRNVFTADEREFVHTLCAARPFQIGGGALACRHSGWNHRYNNGGEGGLNNLDTTSWEQYDYLCGLDSAAAPALRAAAAFTPFLAPEEFARLNAEGYLVLAPARVAAEFGGDDLWAEALGELRTQFMAYFNYVMLRAHGRNGDRAFDLDNPEDLRWEAVSGRRVAMKRHFGDEWVFYARNEATGERSHNPQLGGALITGDSGMGAATNVYDLPRQLAIELSEPVWRLMAQLYGTHELMCVFERFRIKTGPGELGLHTDTLLCM